MNLVKVYYGFGDSLQDGFGFNFQIGDHIIYRLRQWCNEISAKIV
jgi:hypothetical protein